MNYYKTKLKLAEKQRGSCKCFHVGKNIYYYTDYNLVYHGGTYTLVLYFGDELIAYLSESTIDIICRGENEND